MSFALLFAVLMILWVIFAVMTNRRDPEHVIIWILLAILGFYEFGPLIHR